jgi:hypothetical protein
MIRYTLVCDRRHEFESWFSGSADYDVQAARGFVACPMCGSAKVEKALMTPRLVRSERAPRQGTRQEADQEADHEARREQPHQASGQGAREEAPAPAEAAPAPMPVAIMTSREQELRKKLRELRDHIVHNAENVGSRFPEEARKMHYGEKEHRSIYGIASAEDAEALHEEGIAFSALPVLPEDRN